MEKVLTDWIGMILVGDGLAPRKGTKLHCVSQNLSQELNPRKQIERLIRTDSKQQFIMFLRNQWESSNGTSIFSQSELFKLVCTHRAVDCATALLDGEAGLTVDVNEPWEDGSSPLHLAAQNLSFTLTELLLQHGAKANSCNNNGKKNLATVPLSKALAAIRDHQCVINWSPEKSIYKLIYIFCLEEMREPLNTIKLLASKTENLEDLGLYLVTQGEVTKFAALFMVAWDRLVAPSISKGVEDSPIGEYLWGLLEMVTAQELELMIACNPNCMCLLGLKNKKNNLLAQWKLLKILEKGRDVIDEYRHSWRAEFVRNYEVPYDVGYKLFHAGFALHPDDIYCDDVKCLQPKLEKEHKERLNKDIEKILHSASILSTPARCYQKNMRQTDPTPVSSAMLAFPSRQFHTVCNLNFKYREPPASRITGLVHVMEPSSPRFLRAVKICASLVLSAKKCVKKI